MAKRKIALVVVCILLCFSSQVGAIDSEVGAWLTDFTLYDMELNAVRTEDFQGEYTLFCVWVSWSDPSVSLIKALNHNSLKFKQAGIRAVAVAAAEEEDLEQIKKFAEEERLDFLSLFTEQENLQSYWDVNNVPAVFLVDPEGKVIMKSVGYNGFADLWGQITAVLDTSKVESDRLPVFKKASYQTSHVTLDYESLATEISLDFVDYIEKEFTGTPAVQLMKEPDYGAVPVYGAIRVGEEIYVMAATDPDKCGFMDKIYVDFNHNLDLTDDGEPLEFKRYEEFTEVLFPVKVVVDTNDTAEFVVDAYTYQGQHIYFYYNRQAYLAQLETDLGLVMAVLVDADTSGHYDDPQDVVLIDLNRNGKFDQYSLSSEVVQVMNPLMVGERSQMIDAESRGQQKVIVIK